MIYTPPSSSRMTFKRDCRLGMDDFLLWPQPFIDEHCHLAAIPRPPEQLNPNISTHILFSNALDDEHFVPNHSCTLAGLGNLSRNTLQKLKAVEENLQRKADIYSRDDAFPKKTPVFANILGGVKLYIEALDCLPMTRRQLGFVFSEFQRSALEFIGVHQYLHIYKPRMENVEEPASKVYRTVGTFVSSVIDCEAFFRAGIPVWLVRPARLAGSVRVDSLVQLVDPKDHLCLDDASHQFRVSFKGSPTDPMKYKTFTQYTRHFLAFGDPFNTGLPSESSASTSSTNKPSASSNVARSDPLPLRSKDKQRPAPCRSSRNSYFIL